MSELQFKKTTVQLGESKNAYIVKAKSKYKPISSGFCPYCYLTVQLIQDSKCVICGNKVGKQPTYESVKKKFKIICNANKIILDDWIADRPQNEQLQIPMQIGQKTYMVSLRYFREFENLEMTDDTKEDAYQLFFEYVKRISKEVKGW